MAEGVTELRSTSDGMRNEKIWLAADFREALLEEGIEKAGSVNQLGRILGYRSRVHPGWSVRQLINGAQPFTLERLVILCDYLGHPLDEVLRYKVPRRRALNHQSVLATPHKL